MRKFDSLRDWDDEEGRVMVMGFVQWMSFWVDFAILHYFFHFYSVSWAGEVKVFPYFISRLVTTYLGENFPMKKCLQLHISRAQIYIIIELYMSI